MIAIYRLISPSNKVYIGQTAHLRTRKSKYRRLRCEGQPHLFNSLKKYGFDNHLFKVLHELPDDTSQEIVNEYEKTYLDFHRCANFSLLNIRDAGTHGRHSEETRKKMSENKTYFKHSEDVREVLRHLAKGNKNMLGKFHSEYSKKKISEGRKGWKPSEATLLRMRNKKSEQGRLNIIEGSKDKTIYRFINKLTKEEFIGKRYDFMVKYKLQSASISRLIHGEYQHTKNWKLAGTNYITLNGL